MVFNTNSGTPPVTGLSDLNALLRRGDMAGHSYVDGHFPKYNGRTFIIASLRSAFRSRSSLRVLQVAARAASQRRPGGASDAQGGPKPRPHGSCTTPEQRASGVQSARDERLNGSRTARERLASGAQADGREASGAGSNR